jgi:tRNA threonylcarbamoyladenosine modification (KEOPS) complex Cgi121 subunit
MPTIDLAPGFPFHAVLVMGLTPKDPALFQDALEKLHSAGSKAQILDGRGVAGLEHIETAAWLAANSFGSGRNLARSPATELLLYASASRQIKEAIQRLGVNPSSKSWILVAVDRTGDATRETSAIFLSYGKRDDCLIENLQGKMTHLKELYGISGEELAFAQTIHGNGESALKALVMERVALSELYR